MPRDLELEEQEQDLESMPTLEREPPNSAPRDDEQGFAEANDEATDKIQRDMQRESGLLELKPIRQLLTLDDLESCVILENAAFEHPEHRCSREKVSLI